MNKFELIIYHALEISEDKVAEFRNGLEKLKNNMPVQYLTNHQEFMKLHFFVDENVLIPQPDTEILVEEVIKYINEIQNLESDSDKEEKHKTLKILDLCTGSGAIAISIAKNIENCKITATDISSKALQIAKLNAEKNLVHKKISFIESDMFANISENSFDIIVSNPPYIETNTIPLLSKEVQYEPTIALDGGTDGLDFYKTIIDNYQKYLNKNGKVFLEIGYNQKNSLFELIHSHNKNITTTCIKDLSGNDRVIIF